MRMSALVERRVKLSDQAYDALRRMIMRGELAPGARLSEPDLTDQLGIGRTPLREALLLLAQDGLIHVLPQSGSFVSAIDLDRVREAQFIREHLECGIIRQVAASIDRRGLGDIRRLLEQQEEAHDDNDPDRFYDLDEDLHATFCRIAERPGVWRLIHQSKIHMDRVRQLSLPIADQIPRLIGQHRAIMQALGQSDPDAAEAALRIHLREVFATIDTLGLDATTTTAR
jgi:GntR family transcriptional regulator, rspAB operon transcriptional repressor